MVGFSFRLHPSLKNCSPAMADLPDPVSPSCKWLTFYICPDRSEFLHFSNKNQTGPIRSDA